MYAGVADHEQASADDVLENHPRMAERDPGHLVGFDQAVRRTTIPAYGVSVVALLLQGSLDNKVAASFLDAELRAAVSAHGVAVVTGLAVDWLQDPVAAVHPGARAAA